MSGLCSVITTIQSPTPSVNALLQRLQACDGKLIVIGDKKGPADYKTEIMTKLGAQDDSNLCEFFSLQDQLESEFKLAELLPTGHYSRKNLGYLYAIAQGAFCIYETDDDNAPLAHWQPRGEYVQDVRVIEPDASEQPQAGRWVNIYKYFSVENIWPRGLPLNEIHIPVPAVVENGSKYWSPVQQGLVNGSPDVDAIWRLVQDHNFNFDNNRSVYLPPGYWSPFNTQSTWWWPAAYPLLYIPSYCSFRMCDIWKSFVAQRCLWELGAGVTFHGPEVVQKRNVHNLMRDFRDEIPGYEKNDKFTKELGDLELPLGMEFIFENIKLCYQSLVTAGFFPKEELLLLDAWIGDLKDFLK